MCLTPPSSLPSFTHSLITCPLGACWMPGPCWVLEGMRHGPFLPREPGWALLTTDERPVLEGPGSPPKLGPLWALRGGAWPLTHARISATGKLGAALPRPMSPLSSRGRYQYEACLPPGSRIGRRSSK